MRFAFSVGMVLTAACLAPAFGCGARSSMDAGDTAAASGGAGGSSTGGAATGGAAQTSSTGPTSSTGTAAGGACAEGVPVPDVFLGDEPCGCDGEFSVQLETECGTTVLDAPYRTDLVFCDVQVAHAVAYECKGTHFSLTVLACADPLKSPCLSMTVSQTPDGTSSEGLWIDGSGNQWKLSDVQMPGALPWSFPSAKGAFTATATRDDGTTQQIKGDYDVCIASAAICPI